VDFDGDGRLDLLSGSNCCDPLGFVFFRRREDGGWEPLRHLKVRPPSNEAPVDLVRSFVTAADWDGDGLSDLLWREHGAILVAPGPFNDAKPIVLARRLEISPKVVPGEGSLADFAVADWDRDGKPDLLVRSEARGMGGTIRWHRNLGAPGLTKLAKGMVMVEFPGDQSIEGFCVCDWNADGRPDLVVTRFERLPTKNPLERQQYRESVWFYPRS